MGHQRTDVHLLVLVTNYPPRRGGVELHVQAVARRLVARGIPVTVVCLDDPAGERDDAGVRVVTLGRRLDFGAVLAIPGPWRWRSVLAEVLPQATHVSVHTRFFPLTWLGVGAARRAGLPVILTEHGAGPVRTASPVVNVAAGFVDRTLGRAAMRRATVVASVSDRVADFVHHLAGVTSSDVGNGVDLATWAPEHPPDARRRLVFAGRLVDEKGWSDFLDVVVAVRARWPDVDAVMAGDGPRRGAVEARVVSRGLVGTVRLLGTVDQARLAAEGAGAVYVNPSVAAEGFQLTVLEMLAAGARVVSYDVGGVRALAATGAPVQIVPEGAAEALAAAAVREIGAPTPPAPAELMRWWDWDAVAQRYAALIGATSSVGTTEA